MQHGLGRYIFFTYFMRVFILLLFLYFVVNNLQPISVYVRSMDCYYIVFMSSHSNCRKFNALEFNLTINKCLVLLFILLYIIENIFGINSIFEYEFILIEYRSICQ